MMTVVRCSQCDKSESLTVELTHTYSSELCSSCIRLDRREKSWHFCNQKCLTTWMAEHALSGFPCGSCRTTGVVLGHLCMYCKGQGYYAS